MSLIGLVILGIIVAGGIWIHKVGITKAKAEIKADIADLKNDIAKLSNKVPASGAGAAQSVVSAPKS